MRARGPSLLGGPGAVLRPLFITHTPIVTPAFPQLRLLSRHMRLFYRAVQGGKRLKGERAARGAGCVYCKQGDKW